MDPLAQAFASMDRWRHHPAYQLERRADIFFSVYLPEVLAKHAGVEIDPRIVPEFPLKLDLIWPDRPSNQSVKVDYVLFARDRSRVFFVELKTDTASRRERQDEYLVRAKQIGFRALLAGLIEIAQRTVAHQKYHHLLAALQDLGCLALPPDLAAHTFPRVRPGLTKLLGEIVISPMDPPIEVIYLQPTSSDGQQTITFEAFAAHLADRSDPLSQLFADHLYRWQTEAGSVDPSEARHQGHIPG